MHEISHGGGTPVTPRTSGKSGKIPKGSIQGKIKDAMINGTDSYRDIDNGFSAGGHDGNGSPQSSVVNSGSSIINSGSRGPRGPRGPRGSSGGSGGSSGSHHHSGRKVFEYYEAPLAQFYGFNKATAYQEALANTAYRREMEDMRKAGLNPSVIYGSHNTSGADSGIYPRDSSGSGGHGGSGGYGRRPRGGNSGKYVFSGGAYYGIMAAVGTIAAVATKSVGAGMAAAGLTGTALKALNGILKK